ncbi:MAG: S-layer homology domain-containing protein [Clostridia bacterium]|nr:S-layer homology domain-containing protein [Clostridia bacterium]
MKKLSIIIIIIILIIVFFSGFFIWKNIQDAQDVLIEESNDESAVEDLFNDVSKTYWASEYISYLVQRGVMTVDEDNYFYPENNISQKDFIISILKISMPRIEISELTNQELIDFLKEQKILEKDFEEEKLNDSLTNYDAAVLLAKVDIIIQGHEQQMIELNYIDLDKADEIGETLIEHSIARGFFKDNASSQFYPNKLLTKAQIAEILYLFLNV